MTEYFPGQKEYIPEFVSPLKSIYGGDFSSPVARILFNMTSEEGKKEEAAQRKKIAASTISTPAKGKASAAVSTGAVEAAAKVPTTVWQMASNILKEYALQPPQFGIGQFSKASGGGGWGVCCFIFCAATEEEDLAYVRRYKDTFFDIDSTGANGYKLLAHLLVPLMFKYPLVKAFIKWTMVKPMMEYAKCHYKGNNVKRRLFYPIAKFWSEVYSFVGWIGKQTNWTDYMRLHGYWR